MAKQKGKKKSQLIREAIDNLLEKNDAYNRRMIRDRVAGIWKDREDLPDFSALRKSLDRRTS
ncbi:MAG: CopG family transcriptional regulator [Candidatus Omnitrophota bacterium]